MSDDNTVLDTLKFKDGKIFLREYHIDRSYEALSFIKTNVSREEIQNLYLAIEHEFSPQIDDSKILRITLSFNGRLQSNIKSVAKSAYSIPPQVQLIKNILKPSGKGRDSYKWHQRPFWEKALSFKHNLADDIICLNSEGHLTETSRCNLFLYDSKTLIVKTPPLQSGCINGVYRRFVMDTGTVLLPDKGTTTVIEKDLVEDDLFNHSIYVANSIREILPAQLFAACGSSYGGLNTLV